MNPEKPGVLPWSSLGLAAVMLVACLVGAVGIATARYRAEQQAGAYFQPQAPVQVYLGQLRPDETTQTYTFDTAQQSWQPVETEDSRYYQLSFAISNGPTVDSFQEFSQQVRIRLVGSVGLWDMDEEVPVVLKLRVPKPVEEPEPTDPTETTAPTTATDPTGTTAPTDATEPEPTEPPYDEYTATVTRIVQGTSLYNSFGDGWVFRFTDENGRELTWELEGGQFSCITLELILEGSDPAVTTLLQLQIIGDKVTD